MMEAALLWTHALATIAMSGVIWFVQLVHYPLLALVGDGEFDRFAAENVRRTTRVVAPLMIAEFATAVLLAFTRGTLAWIGLGLLAAVWVSTAILQVPRHQRLLEGFDAAAVRALVRSNWVRTVAWTLRAVLALILLRTA